jgi:cytochrome c5
MTKRLGQALLTIVLALAANNEIRAQDGGALYTQLCSTCHDGGNERAPSPNTDA